MSPSPSLEFAADSSTDAPSATSSDPLITAVGGTLGGPATVTLDSWVSHPPSSSQTVTVIVNGPPAA